jgi:hypothetical protein
MTSTRTNLARCTMRGHRIAIGINAGSGWYQVGCDGLLVGNYPTTEKAIAEARERVRMKSGCTTVLPRVSQTFVDAVAELAGGVR